MFDWLHKSCNREIEALRTKLKCIKEVELANRREEFDKLDRLSKTIDNYRHENEQLKARLVEYENKRRSKQREGMRPKVKPIEKDK